VVEHSIGNGEVDSSILSGSTILFNNIKRRLAYRGRAFGGCAQNEA
jgi:hypothetical protein